MPDWKDEIKKVRRPQPRSADENEIVEELGQHLEDVYERSLQ